MSKHTPGLINLETKPTSCGVVHKLHPLSTCIYEDGARRGDDSEQRANAERLRDCWNACEGIEDPAKLPLALKDIRLAAQHIRDGLREIQSRYRFQGAEGRIMETLFIHVSDIIAKAEGRNAAPAKVSEQPEEDNWEHA